MATYEELNQALIKANTDRSKAEMALWEYKRDTRTAVAAFVDQMQELFPDAEHFPSCALDLAEAFGIEVLADPDLFPDGNVYADSPLTLTDCDDPDCDGECDCNFCEARE